MNNEDNAEDIRMYMLCDMNYLAGMKAGWNFAQVGDDETFNKVVEDMRKLIREAKGKLNGKS